MVCLELLLDSLLGVVSQVAVQQLVSVDLHQVQHGQCAGVLVHLQGSDITFLDTANYRTTVVTSVSVSWYREIPRVVFMMKRNTTATGRILHNRNIVVEAS